MVSKQITVVINREIYTELIQAFVQKANNFVSEVKIVRHNKIIDGKSLLGLLSLGIETGNVVTIKAEGSDEKEAVEFLAKVLKGEEE
ncbi:HPr family phosphocarrier protein [Sutcliffiella rhizosphaerae]|uniref:Phosphocarrier protein HPr n=1 Tax=Sutcliffiella rhizosphaerae TaxID=2880967 RepID=A0ABM8YL07_9BACI|nr:HPr family phosphocarrier protein [Sutcliffiella rhizosphaerae]CAG9620636.1 Phosphocarrier protein HPr [Sutcliffiella rhizosphaerae]